MEKEKKILDVLTGSTVRQVINDANTKGIQKEDIVQLFSLSDQVYLIYYK